MTADELWCRCPLVDRHTRNLSATRCAATVALVCWCHVAEHTHAFNIAGVLVLGIIAVMFFSKNIGEFTQGARALGSIVRGRRSTDSQPVVNESERL